MRIKWNELIFCATMCYLRFCVHLAIIYYPDRVCLNIMDIVKARALYTFVILCIFNRTDEISIFQHRAIAYRVWILLRLITFYFKCNKSVQPLPVNFALPEPIKYCWKLLYHQRRIGIYYWVFCTQCPLTSTEAEAGIMCF